MLYPSLSQPLVFFALFLAGIGGGLVFAIAKVCCRQTKVKIIQHAVYFIATILNFVLFYFVNLWSNYGSIRVYGIAGFLLGVGAQLWVLAKLFVFLKKKCYNLKHGKGKKEKNS